MGTENPRPSGEIKKEMSGTDKLPEDINEIEDFDQVPDMTEAAEIRRIPVGASGWFHPSKDFVERAIRNNYPRFMQRQITIVEDTAKDTGKHYYRAIASVPTSIVGWQGKAARIQKSLDYLLAQDAGSVALYSTPPHMHNGDFYENKGNVDKNVEDKIPLYKKFEKALADLSKNFELKGAMYRQFRVSNVEEKTSENPRGRCLVQLEWQWQSSSDHRRTSIDLTCGIDETRSAALQLLVFVKQNQNAFNNPRKAPSISFDPNFDTGSQ